MILLARTGSKPVIDRVFPFDQLLPAFDRLAAGPMGKILDPDSKFPFRSRTLTRNEPQAAQRPRSAKSALHRISP